MVLYGQGLKFLGKLLMSKTDCEKVQNDSEQFCPRLRHVLYNYVRDDSGDLSFTISQTISSEKTLALYATYF